MMAALVANLAELETTGLHPQPDCGSLFAHESPGYLVPYGNG
jgi:hypothetical protein